MDAAAVVEVFPGVTPHASAQRMTSDDSPGNLHHLAAWHLVSPEVGSEYPGNPFRSIEPELEGLQEAVLGEVGFVYVGEGR